METMELFNRAGDSVGRINIPARQKEAGAIVVGSQVFVKEADTGRYVETWAYWAGAFVAAVGEQPARVQGHRND